MTSPQVVAVINTSPDAVELVRAVLQHAGLTVITGFSFDIREGRLDLPAMLLQHGVKVLVYDISPPYDENWALFSHLRQLETVRDTQVVITSTNAAHVSKLASPADEVYELVEKPYDLQRIVKAVRNAMRIAEGR